LTKKELKRLEDEEFERTLKELGVQENSTAVTQEATSAKVET
jgi:hypothetical protein